MQNLKRYFHLVTLPIDQFFGTVNQLTIEHLLLF